MTGYSGGQWLKTRKQMDKYGWMIRFKRKDGKPDEELYFNDELSARDAFGLYNDPDSDDLYSLIELVRVDWNSQSTASETLISQRNCFCTAGGELL